VTAKVHRNDLWTTCFDQVNTTCDRP